VSFNLPPLLEKAESWLQRILPYWQDDMLKVDWRLQVLENKLPEVGVSLTILSAAQANALQVKDTSRLYLCSQDPGNLNRGSGFYQWSGSAWVKFA